MLRTLLAAADGGEPRHSEAARRLHDAARTDAEGLLAAAERETRHPRRRDALTADALRAAAAVDRFSEEVGPLSPASQHLATLSTLRCAQFSPAVAHSCRLMSYVSAAGVVSLIAWPLLYAHTVAVVADSIAKHAMSGS